MKTFNRIIENDPKPKHTHTIGKNLIVFHKDHCFYCGSGGRGKNINIERESERERMKQNKNTSFILYLLCVWIHRDLNRPTQIDNDNESQFSIGIFFFLSLFSGTNFISLRLNNIGLIRERERMEGKNQTNIN